MAFKRAERKRVFLKMAITGPSGGGKTYSALRLAFGLGKKVAMIDTENGSGSLYADLGEYDVLEIGAPFTVDKYVNAINDAVAGGYDVLIIDSLTHAWAGDGGLLAQKEAADARGGNSYTNWAPITKQHERFKAAILHAPIHIIATMRSKTEYVVEQDARGKSAPRKVGLAPVQRDGMEYEFTVVLDVALDHTAIPSKDRTGLFAGLNALLTEEHGRMVAGWLQTAAAQAPEPEPAPAPTPAPTRTPARQAAPTQVPAPNPHAQEAVRKAEQPSQASQMGNQVCQCSVSTCAQPLTKGQHDISVRTYGRPLCPAHQKGQPLAGEQTPPPAQPSLERWDDVRPNDVPANAGQKGTPRAFA